MQRPSFVVPVLVALSVGAGANSLHARPAAVSPRVEEFFGKDAVAVVRGATSIEIARLRKDPTNGAYMIDEVDRQAGVVGRAFQAILLDHATYDFPPTGESDTKLCGNFEPAAVVRFARAGKPPVDAILSIACIEGGMAAGPTLPKKLAKGASYGGWPKFRAHMGPGQMRVLGLLGRAFPKDVEIKDFIAVARGD
jgi:hypothetical protein